MLANTGKDTSRNTLSSVWDISIQDINKAMEFTFLKGRDSKTQTKVDVLNFDILEKQRN